MILNGAGDTVEDPGDIWESTQNEYQFLFEMATLIAGF